MVVFQQVKEGDKFVSKVIYPKELATASLQSCIQ